MSDSKFKLPGDSYDQVVRILRGYAACKDATGPGEVAAKIATDSTVVSRNNAFLLSIGVLQGGNKKALTDSGKQLANALEHNVEEVVQSSWAGIVEENDFLQGIVSAVKIRNGMDPSALVSHISYSAGVGKSPRTTSGARTVVEVLKAAGILVEEDGKLVYSRPSSPERSLEPREASDEHEPLLVDVAATIPKLRSGAVGIDISIQVQVACTMDELDSLGPKLQELFDTLREPREDYVGQE